MNQLMLVGRLVRPIEQHEIGEHRVVNNCLAVSRKHRDRNGLVPTDFIPIVAWDHLADILYKYTNKGQQIGVVGKIQSRVYTNQANQTVYTLECLVNEITLLDGKQKHTTSSDKSVQSEAYTDIQQTFEVPTESLAQV